jgi:hypothetical protein
MGEPRGARGLTMNASVKRAAAYLRTEKIYLHPDSGSIKGFWIACEPILVTSGSDESLGEQVLQALEKSTANVPDPESMATSDSWKVIKTLVKAAGARSYEGFADSAQCVGIMLDDMGVHADQERRPAKAISEFENENTVPAGRRRGRRRLDGSI